MILEHHQNTALNEAAERITARLSTPRTPAEADRRFAQSLAKGSAGTALLHIERALRNRSTWATAHSWVKAATAFDISAADEAALFIGAPSIDFLLHAANADGGSRYGPALTALDNRVVVSAHRRVDAAMARINTGQAAQFAEYDLFYGLTGIGALLLRRHSGSDALGRILGYLVRLATEPLRRDGEHVPGWWVDHDPDRLVPTPGGHLNFGLAHGIAGPLALLSLTARAGVTVEGQLDAITQICRYTDTWRHDNATASWWPEWLTWAELRAGHVSYHRPPRPSWCYGTPGIARAQQLAAIATADTSRQAKAEAALANSLSSPERLAMITDAGLCHGIAGVYQTAWRADRDSITPLITSVMPLLTELLLAHAARQPDATDDDSLLDGATGLALALHTAVHNAAPASGWDACLLIA